MKEGKTDETNGYYNCKNPYRVYALDYIPLIQQKVEKLSFEIVLFGTLQLKLFQWVTLH